MKINICKNFPKVNKLQKKLTFTFSEDIIIIKKCIGMCNKCRQQPVAKIKNKKIKAKRISTLIRKIDKIFHT